MSENKNLYCYHCLTKIKDNSGEFCHECGQKHSKHCGQSFELLAGTYLCGGRYFVGESIGSGGFGITYVGYDTKLEKKILIKETFYNGLFRRNVFDSDNPEPLKVTYGNDFSLDEIMRKTRKECVSLSEGEGLNNIVKVYDWFSENNTAYIITEFINGITLYDRVREQGRYSWEEYYSKVKQLMISLSTLHKKGIVHRDIKPMNIMIRNVNGLGEEFVLIDFGLARYMETKTIASVGISFSPGYAPYEQRSFAMKDGTYTDVYSLAATSYFAVTGEDPVIDMTPDVDENFPKLRYMKGQYGVPENVVSGLRYALEVNYEERCQTIDELIKYFEKKNRKTENNFEKSVFEAPNTIKPPADNFQDDAAKKKPDSRTQEEYDRIIREAKASINLPKEKEENNKKFVIPALAVLLIGIVIAFFVLFGKNGVGNGLSTESGSQTEDSSTLFNLEKNAKTLNNPLKEAVEEYDKIYSGTYTDITWNGRSVEYATVHDVCVEKNISDSDDFYSRKISGENYYLVWTKDNELAVWGGSNFNINKDSVYTTAEFNEYNYDYYSHTGIKGCTFIRDFESSDYGILIENNTYISDITEAINLATYEVDSYNIMKLNAELSNAVSAYRNDETSIRWNEKNIYRLTVHDVCVEYDIDDSEDFYAKDFTNYIRRLYWESSKINVLYDYGDNDLYEYGEYFSEETSVIIKGDLLISEIAGHKNIQRSVAEFTKDTVTLEVRVKEAVKAYEEGSTDKTWNGKTADEATVHDVCAESNIDDSDGYYKMEGTDGKTYCMGWTSEKSLNVIEYSHIDSFIEVNGDTLIKDLAES